MSFSFLKPVIRGVLAEQRQDAGAIDRAAEMLVYRISVMPPYLSMPMAVLTLVFDWSALFWKGRRFRSLPPGDQRRHLEAWKKSRLGAAKDFVLFYEKMGTFIYFAQKEEAAA